MLIDDDSLSEEIPDRDILDDSNDEGEPVALIEILTDEVSELEAMGEFDTDTELVSLLVIEDDDVSRTELDTVGVFER